MITLFKDEINIISRAWLLTLLSIPGVPRLGTETKIPRHLKLDMETGLVTSPLSLVKYIPQSHR